MEPPGEPRATDWRGLALRLGAAIGVDRLHPGALAAIQSEPEDRPVALACSGGPDSVALVLSLWSAFPSRRGRWLILHFNHRLRGRESEDDARFVRALARELGETAVIGRWKDAPRGGAVASEADARTARLAFFERALARAGARVLALGHQRNDVAETLLMRLTRGSGTAGLSAPRPVHLWKDGSLRVRPLLDIPASDIRDALAAARVPSREDASNQDGLFFRNRVRHSVLPALAEASPSDAAAGIAASRALLEEDDDALGQWLESLLGGKERHPGDLRILRGRPRALVRRAVYAWLHQTLGEHELARPAVENVIEAVASGGSCRTSAGASGVLVVRDGRLSVEPARHHASEAPCRWPELVLRTDCALVGPAGDRLSLRRVRPGPRLLERLASGNVDPGTTAFLDPGADWPGWLLVRDPRPGDRMRPLGAPGRARLQDLFVNRKIPQEQRRRLPVVVLPGGTIVWVPGLPPAMDFAVQPGSKTVVQLTYVAARINVPGLDLSRIRHVRS